MVLKTWTAKLAPAACAALLTVGCGGSDDMNDERRAQAGQAPPQTQQLTLTGCVQTGETGTGYVLRNARYTAREGGTTDQPGITEPATRSAPVAEGSWVQLAGLDENQLRQHVGREVTVSGTITETGDQPVGTAGDKGFRLPSGAESQAGTDQSYPEKVADEVGPIAKESMAESGIAPRMQVASLTPTGESCEAR